MLNVLLVRPGSTTFDEEGRIKGELDIPLSPLGQQQSLAAVEQLKEMPVECLYVAPCESAQATGKILAKNCGWKSRTIECFRNVNHGLWQGKLVDEVRRLQPRLYKQFQENPSAYARPMVKCSVLPWPRRVDAGQAGAQASQWNHRDGDTGAVGLGGPLPSAGMRL